MAVITRTIISITLFPNGHAIVTYNDGTCESVHQDNIKLVNLH